MYVLVPSVERKNNNDRYFEEDCPICLLGDSQAGTGLCVFKMLYWWSFHQYRVWKEGTYISWNYRYVFSKCYIGGHSTNIGFEKRIQIKQDQ